MIRSKHTHILLPHSSFNRMSSLYSKYNKTTSVLFTETKSLLYNVTLRKQVDPVTMAAGTKDGICETKEGVGRPKDGLQMCYRVCGILK